RRGSIDRDGVPLPAHHVCEVFGDQRPNCFLGQHEFGYWLPHRGTIAQCTCRLHASSTCSEFGSFHREMSPANPRVTMPSPSTWTPMTADLCAESVHSRAPLASSQKRNNPSASPAITMPSASDASARNLEPPRYTCRS